ncbi:MAG: hypothetical protein JWL86_805 [Rhizobium sp.]|nr:hypothetical protein [Rhizobium sp.]
MNCILKNQCPHQPTAKTKGGCALLGSCGASVALKASCAVGGYEVCSGPNPTIEALQAAGLVTVRSVKDSRHLLVKAASSVSAQPARQSMESAA